jgi:hypothetical protein
MRDARKWSLAPLCDGGGVNGEAGGVELHVLGWGRSAHTGFMSAESGAAVDAPDDGNVQCWCCSTVGPCDRMVHLGDHPKVHLCLRCAPFMNQQAWRIEDDVRHGLRLGLATGSAMVRRAAVAMGIGAATAGRRRGGDLGVRPRRAAGLGAEPAEP